MGTCSNNTKRTQGILLVYDVTDRRSFESIRNWITQIQQHADVHVNKILVGNKCDMLDEKVVSTEERQKLAKKFNVDLPIVDAVYNILYEKISPIMEMRLLTNKLS